jgi:hypothetical protein
MDLRYYCGFLGEPLAILITYPPSQCGRLEQQIAAPVPLADRNPCSELSSRLPPATQRLRVPEEQIDRQRHRKLPRAFEMDAKGYSKARRTSAASCDNEPG